MTCPVALGAAYKRRLLDEPNLTREEFCDWTRMKVMQRELLAFGVPFFRAASESEIIALRGRSEDGVETLRERSVRIHPSDLAKNEFSLVDLCDEPESDEEQLSFNEEFEQPIGLITSSPFEDWEQFSGEPMTGWAFVRVAPAVEGRGIFVINRLDGKKKSRSSDWCDEIEVPLYGADELDMTALLDDARVLAAVVDNEIGRTLDGGKSDSDERKILRNSRRAVRSCLGVMRGLSPREELIVARALEAMLRLGRMAPDVERLYDDFNAKRAAEHVAQMRAARARKSSDQDKALDDAISKYVKSPSKRGHYTIARRHLLSINRDLAEQGVDEVNVDKLARRLKRRSAE